MYNPFIVNIKPAETLIRLSELESTRRRADGRPSDVLCVAVVCLSVYVSLTRARALSDGRVRAPRVLTSPRWVRVRCVLCDARGSGRGDACTTTRSTRLFDTVVTLASVDYIYTHGARV